MIAASRPVQRPPDARLLVAGPGGRLLHAPRSRFVDVLRPGDLVIANDAATLPASLHGVHVRTGAAIEVRLAARSSLDPNDVRVFSAIVFGAGNYRTRTEDRPPPPALVPGDGLDVGPLCARVEAMLGHPRLVRLRFDGQPDAIWAGLARHGRPIQYAHVPDSLAVWDVWTPIAGAPVAFEPPSAGFALDWRTLRAMRERGIAFATITLAAGISSTGDPQLDARLPFDEPYRIPHDTVCAIRRALQDRRRIVAIGTTVVRALEHAADGDGIREGEGIATRRIGRDTPLRVVDAILSGTHEPDSSHYQLLRAFVDDGTLREVDDQLEALGYRTHEFGDSVLIFRMRQAASSSSPPGSSLVTNAPAAVPATATRIAQTTSARLNPSTVSDPRSAPPAANDPRMATATRPAVRTVAWWNPDAVPAQASGTEDTAA